MTVTIKSGLGKLTKSALISGDWECEFKGTLTRGDSPRVGIISAQSTSGERYFAGIKNANNVWYADASSSTSMSESNTYVNAYNPFTARITCINNTVTIYLNGTNRLSKAIDWNNTEMTLAVHGWSSSVHNITLDYFRVKPL